GEASIERGHLHVLRFKRNQVALHGAAPRIVKTVMRKLVEIELTAEFFIDATQQVEVELARQTLAVVVSLHQHLNVFLQVEANEQVVTIAQVVPYRPQEAHRIAMFEVADIGAEEQHQSRATRLKTDVHLTQ